MVADITVRARAHAALGDPGRLAIVDALGYGDVSPGEIARELDLPGNLVAHHLKVLEAAGLITRTRSEGDRRRTYLRLVHTPPSGPAPRPAPPRVVFVCTHNSARSQLAAALWATRSPVPATSAGTRPAARVHPRAVRIAHRHGLPLGGDTRTAHIADVVGRGDLVIAVCDNAHEQLSPQPQRLHWSVPDPAPAGTDTAFEAAYTELAGRIDRLAPVLTQGA